MPTEWSRDLFGYEVVEGRQVVAAFDGGDNTSDAGGLLTLAGKLAAKRPNCAPLAGKSTLNRPEHAPLGASR